MRRLALLLAIPGLALAQTPPPSPASAPATKPVVDKQDKVICKSTTDIGSLIATTKTCRTRREWDRLQQDIRERGPLGNCPGGAQGGSCG